MPARADLVADRPFQLGREGAVADSRRIGLEAAERQVDAGGRDAAAGAGASGGGVAAGHVGIGAEVEVEHGGLGAFQEHVVAAIEGALDEREGVLDVGVELARIAEVLLEDGLRVELGLAVQLVQDRVLHLSDHEVDLLAHEDLLLEVADAEADAAHLVAISGADAAPGGSQPVVAAHALFEAVEDRVVAHDHVRALADDQVVGLQAALAQLLDLLQDHTRIDHHAVADDARDLRVEDSAGQQLELELAVLGDHGVAGVVAALWADHEVGLLGQVVDDLALALVAPLPADDDDHHGARAYSSSAARRRDSRL